MAKPAPSLGPTSITQRCTYALQVDTYPMWHGMGTQRQQEHVAANQVALVQAQHALVQIPVTSNAAKCSCSAESHIINLRLISEGHPGDMRVRGLCQGWLPQCMYSCKRTVKSPRVQLNNPHCEGSNSVSPVVSR